MNIEELRKNQWLRGPAWLKQFESEWTGQLSQDSDERNVPESVSFTKVAPLIRLRKEGSSTYNHNSISISKNNKTLTLTVRVEENEKNRGSHCHVTT